MESDATPPLIDKLWVWGNSHWKQALWGLAALLVVAMIIVFWFTHQTQQQVNANEALSRLAVGAIMPNAPSPSADSMLRIASDYPNTDAGQRAFLLGASGLFAQGKFDDALGHYNRFLQEHPESPFAGQAALGVAASMEGQGRTNEAINQYRSVGERFAQNWNVAPLAKLSLARLLQAQDKLADARDVLMDILRSYQQAEASSEANLRLRELFTAHPDLIPQNPNQQSGPAGLENPNRPTPPAPRVIATNSPTPSAPSIISTNRLTPPPAGTQPATNKP